ncbi:MAG: tautomerase [Betaproteobacteria bacterium]|jgi:phenylpyruvate tautomerase PptA (4-oxalocrotonate tautomerase family)|nr:tautomerase [Betaproteobacteria bacterium]NBT68541.1 tautomerase [Betaproteobacteria bacterium]NBY06441.1 tautomerase [Betaproteobacteria bacterium]
MPVISVTLLPGYPTDVQERLVQRLATAARSVIAAAPAGTTIFVNEASTYQRDSKVFTKGGASRSVASELVHSFLMSMQERNLEKAQTFIAPHFFMCFPSGVRMTQLHELDQWAQSRYKSIEKNFENIDECWTGEGAIVYCSGTLSGIFNDNKPFEKMRFIDRFEVVDGLIVRQDVWNDLRV